MARSGESRLKRRCCVGVGGVVGLSVEGAVEESVGDSGLAWATMLAAPEAAELGGLDGIAWHW